MDLFGIERCGIDATCIVMLCGINPSRHYKNMPDIQNGRKDTKMLTLGKNSRDRFSCDILTIDDDNVAVWGNVYLDALQDQPCDELMDSLENGDVAIAIVPLSLYREYEVLLKKIEDLETENEDLMCEVERLEDELEDY